MVIDTKAPPLENEVPPVPPPAYPADYPEPSGPSYPTSTPPAQGNGYPPQTGPQSPAPAAGMPYVDQTTWMGQQYRNQMFARCAQGDHDVTTTFGLCGIICAILLFPIGLICLCIDTEKKCARCGVRLG